MSEHVYDPPLGNVAYSAYRDFMAGLNLPLWEELDESTQRMWNTVGQKLAAYLDRIPR